MQGCHELLQRTSGNASMDAQEVIVELILGTDDNQRSVIRYGSAANRQTVFNTATPNILHCNELRTFWLSWDHSDGTVKVGRGPLIDEQGFMQWTNNRTPRQFYNAIGLSCATGSAAMWVVNENSGKETHAAMPRILISIFQLINPVAYIGGHWTMPPKYGNWRMAPPLSRENDL